MGFWDWLMPEQDGAGGDAAYLSQWNRRDADLRAGGMGPSKLGPGVPAVTESGLFGTRVWDDSGIEITGREGGGGRLPNGRSPQQQEAANMSTLAKAEANHDDLRAAGYHFVRGVGWVKPGAPTIPESQVNLADTAGVRRAMAEGEPDEEGDEEEARGPGGPKMPRPVDLPNYTIFGATLRRLDAGFGG